jgi:DNA-binding response OmpR family regulator
MAGHDAPVAAAQEPPVLVVDPDSDQGRLLATLLSRAGFRANVVASGEQALEEVRRERPQLVLLEVRLEDISGYEVCRALREDFGEALGIMFLSGDRNEASDRVAGLLLGADDYLGKPVAEDELLARVRALARRAGAYDHLKAPALRAGLTARELGGAATTRGGLRPARDRPAAGRRPQDGWQAHRTHPREAAGP